MNQDENLKESDPDKEILRVAKERYQRAQEAWKDIFDDARDDIKFSAGEQWPEEVLFTRQYDNRPCLTINRIPQIIHQITNDQRQARPAIKISPVDDQADIETAKIYQGVIRNIEYSSNADTAYDTAFDSAVRGGFGFWRIITEFSNPMSFDQNIIIKRIADRFSVLLDPDFQEPDGSDAKYGFISDNILKEDYKLQFPDSEVSKSHDWGELVKTDPDWIDDNFVKVVEYLYKETKEIEIALLNSGEVIELTENLELPEGSEVVDTRKTQVPVVKWCKINGCEILEKKEWAGSFIPIVIAIGEEIIVEGKRQFISITRYAKDPQRMYNYWKSAETETIALAPRAPWIGFEGQFEGHEAQWNTANTRNHPYLEVKPTTIDGQPAPLPQRNVVEPPVQAITQASRFAAEDIKATTGIYDAALGADAGEKSGIAIQRRTNQAQTSNFHFMDNLSKSIRHTGRIILELMPSIYDTARALRMLGEDGSEEVIRVNDPSFQYKGEQKLIRFGVGEYDATVDSGPSFETKRQEAVAMMADLSKSFPQLMQVAGDIMVKNMDWNGASEIAERLKKTIPPELIDDPNHPASQKVPPQVQQQMTQMGQMMDQLTKTVHALQNEKDQKLLENQDKQADRESRERIAMANIQSQIAIKEAELGSKASIILLQEQLAQIKHSLEMDQSSQELNEMPGPDQSGSLDDQQQQPTGGQSPGNTMGV